MYVSPIPLEERRVIRVSNLVATPDGNYEAYLDDLQQHTHLDIKSAPQIFTTPKRGSTREELWKLARQGDLILAECSDGTIQGEILPFMADPNAPSDLVLATTPIGNAKNDHKAVVPKRLWTRPSEVIKQDDTATIYPLRTRIFQPEDESKELPARSDVELAVAITSLGGIATGAVFLEASKRRAHRSALKRRAHALFGSHGAELATLLYDTCISVSSLRHIENIRYSEHPNGLDESVAEAFVNAHKVAKVARFKKADLLMPGFEYGTIGPGKINQIIAIGRLIAGTLPTETIMPKNGQRLHFRLAPDQAANMELDGDPRRLRGGSSVDVDQVTWSDSTHRPIQIVVARALAEAA